jgi:predicted O-methyltransferase YrrM
MSVPFSTHLHWLRAALRFYWRAQNRYDVHSPFLSDWLEAVLEDDREYYAFDEIEIIRQHWLRTSQKIDYSTDLGAGSRAGQSQQRAVKDMAQWSSVNAATGRRLFRMMQFAQPRTMLELGTNLGFSAMYLQRGAVQAKLYTIEGQATVARLAQESFKRLGTRYQAEIITGDFNEVLPDLLPKIGSVDVLWLDGDHREEATLAYFEQVLPYLSFNAMVAIGDIHWSPGMEAAWEQLKQHPAVSLSVDVFDFGVLFFREEQKEVEHFSLVPYHYKPWRLGFF